MRIVGSEMVGAVDISADIERFHSMGLLNILLKDRSTGNNIRWASNVFDALGDSYAPTDEILVSDVTGDNAGLIRTRASKAREAQAALTRAHAEVFTPTWIVDKMVDAADEAWWEANPDATWQDYVKSPRLEITCGEAPYLVGRYDAADGTPVPLDQRVGILDRKLRLVSEHTTARKTWVKYANMALKSTYGYEYQGDNLLIARVNVLATLEEFAREAGYEIPASTYRKFATVISWNLWQMDGLSDSVPDMDNTGCEHVEDPDPLGETPQLTGFDEWYASAGNVVIDAESEETQEDVTRAKVRNWDSGEVVCFADLKKEGSDMKFDYVIGNPPYQDETVGGNTKYAPQIYNLFMDASYEVGQCVLLIHPGRFLFEAGSTPSWWNRKMLDDKHFKVLHYEPNEKVIFPGTEITGGIAITLHDTSRVFKPVGVFTSFDELNRILHKVIDHPTFVSMQPIVVSRTAYRFTDKMHEDYPEAVTQLSNGHAYDVASNIFESLPQVFHEEKPDDGQEYILMQGLYERKRTERYVRRDYIRPVVNLDAYKIVMARADGAAGTIGKPVPARIMGNPITAGPGIGTTESFLTIGTLSSTEEVENLLKYVKSRFMRTMLGVLKTTQDINPKKFKYVPLQDFTSSSDIDWSQSISDIDRQLYAKYGLDDEEVAFIESHVKEMS